LIFLDIALMPRYCCLSEVYQAPRSPVGQTWSVDSIEWEA